MALIHVTEAETCESFPGLIQIDLDVAAPGNKCMHAHFSPNLNLSNLMRDLEKRPRDRPCYVLLLLLLCVCSWFRRTTGKT